jgi:hypothetical protein
MPPLTPILSLENRGVQPPLTPISSLNRSVLIRNILQSMMKFRKRSLKSQGAGIASTAVLEVMEYLFLHYQFLNQDAQLVNLEPPNCTTTSITFLSCALPVDLEASVDRPSQQSCELDGITDSHIQSLSWFTETIFCIFKRVEESSWQLSALY